MYRNNLELETLRSKWDTPPVVENDRAEIPWDFRIHTDDQVMANKPEFEVGDRRAVMINVAVPNDNSIRKRNKRNWRNTRV